MIKIWKLLIFLFAIPVGAALAQTDTLRLDITKAESLFLKNNYDLLINNYKINEAMAEVVTAKLFDNPELEYENLFYNHETKKFLQTSSAYGQYAASISQLFKLAGKRNNNIKLNQLGVKNAELAYFDLLRTLKYELHTVFYKTYYTAQSVKVYQDQIDATAHLLKAYQTQLSQGNVAQKDVIRIQSLVISLKADLSSALNDLEDNYKELKLLCGINATIPVVLNLNASVNYSLSIQKIPYTALLDSARANRADLKLIKNSLIYGETNFKLQKALAVPDITISLSYDLKGNYPEKYTGLGFKIPIPLFNRNQGEITKARIEIDAANLEIKKQELLLENEVFKSYKTALRNEKLCDEIDPDFGSIFNKLISGLIKNFRERNISLIEFLDLYDSYKSNTLQLNTLQLEKINSRAEINYVTGSNIFK